MQRRGFLGMLMGMAAAPVLARVPLFEPRVGLVLLDAPTVILPTIHEWGMVVGVSIEGLGIVPGVAFGRLLRGDQSMLDLPVSAQGGYAHWQPPLGGEILFTPEHPLVLDASGVCSVSMSFLDNEGRPWVRRITDGKVVDISARAS